MTNLLLDARKLRDFGIGTYISELFGGIIRSNEFACRALYLPQRGHLDLPKADQIPCRSKNYHFFEQVEIPWKLHKYPDIPFFSPHYVFPLALKNPLIVTIHDLIHFKFPQFFKPAIKVKIARHFIHEIRRRAQLMLTDSESTKTDLCEMFHFRPEQVEVVYIGIAEPFFSQVPKEVESSRPYLLYSGNLKPHKNLPCLLEAFHYFVKENPDFELVLAGLSPSRELLTQIDRWGLRDQVRIPGFLPQNELIDLIDGCLFFVFPSLYEGFGLPPLEAMSRKKAVLCSDCGSLGEVIGPAAFYIDPSNSDSILQGMRHLTGDASLRQQLERLGYDRSLDFPWSQTIERTISLIKERF